MCVAGAGGSSSDAGGGGSLSVAGAGGSSSVAGAGGSSSVAGAGGSSSVAGGSSSSACQWLLRRDHGRIPHVLTTALNIPSTMPLRIYMGPFKRKYILKYVF